VILFIKKRNEASEKKFVRQGKKGGKKGAM